MNESPTLPRKVASSGEPSSFVSGRTIESGLALPPAAAVCVSVVVVSVAVVSVAAVSVGVVCELGFVDAAVEELLLSLLPPQPESAASVQRRADPNVTSRISADPLCCQAICLVRIRVVLARVGQERSEDALVEGVARPADRGRLPDDGPGEATRRVGGR